MAPIFDPPHPHPHSWNVQGGYNQTLRRRVPHCAVVRPLRAPRVRPVRLWLVANILPRQLPPGRSGSRCCRCLCRCCLSRRKRKYRYQEEDPKGRQERFARPKSRRVLPLRRALFISWAAGGGGRKNRKKSGWERWRAFGRYKCTSEGSRRGIGCVESEQQEEEKENRGCAWGREEHRRVAGAEEARPAWQRPSPRPSCPSW